MPFVNASWTHTHILTSTLMRVVRERGATLLRGRRLLAPRPDHDQDDHDSGGGRDPGGATEAPQLARDEDDEQGGGRDQAGSARRPS